jgi:hypothetical protein
VRGVSGRILEQDDPGRHLHTELFHRLDGLEHRALAGDIGPVIALARFDIVEAAQREEVVFVVVVEG